MSANYRGVTAYRPYELCRDVACQPNLINQNNSFIVPYLLDRPGILPRILRGPSPSTSQSRRYHVARQGFLLSDGYQVSSIILSETFFRDSGLPSS